MADNAQEKDQGFKSVTDRDPEGTIRELGGLGWEADIVVTPLRTSVSVRIEADQLFEVAVAGGDTFLSHFEAESHFASEEAGDALRRAVIVALERRMHIRTTLVLHDPSRPAKSFDPVRVLDYGSVRIVCEFSVARLWLMNPGRILARNRTQMLPMVIAMDSTPEQIREASLRIEMVEPESERRRLFQEMATFGSLKYNEDEIDDLIGRVKRKMLPSMEVIRETQIGKRIQEIARYEGRREGEAEGRRRTLRQLMDKLVPDLVDIPDSALPTGENAVNAMLNVLLTEKDSARVRRAILGEDTAD